MKHAHGTRFEFVLLEAEPGEGGGAGEPAREVSAHARPPAAARYLATVERPPDGPRAVTVEITSAGTAAIVGDAGGLSPELAAQLVALAKTIGRRADDAPWPRRINRWRQPGVR